MFCPTFGDNGAVLQRSDTRQGRRRDPAPYASSPSHAPRWHRSTIGPDSQGVGYVVMVSDKRFESRLALIWWGALAGMLVCVLGYWPSVFALRDAWDVPGFPPGGGPYWLAWTLPLGAVATIGTTVFALWHRARPAAGGFTIGCLFTGPAMCAFGYSVDNMPYSM